MNSNAMARWRQIRLAFFFLLVPGSLSGEYEGHNSTKADSSSSSSSSSSSTSNNLRNSGDLSLSASRSKLSRIIEEEDNSNSNSNPDATGVARDLNSNSESESSNEDDYWRRPDDFFGERDDDFYKFIGDPAPPTMTASTKEVIGFMLASLGVTLGSSAGIGGGGIVVPVYIIVMGLTPRWAIPLGSVTVLGGSMAAFILNLRRRHPLADRPIIDWDMILVMEPLVLIGALLGAILHRVVSEKILTVLLVLLLSVAAHTTLAKAKRMYDAEARYIEHLKAARWDYLGRASSFRSAFRVTGWSTGAVGVAPADDPESKTFSPMHLSTPARTHSMDSRSTIQPMYDDEKQRILILNPDFVTLRTDLAEQEKFTRKGKVMALLGKFSVLIFLNITLGGGAFKSPWGIQCGSVAFWVVHVIMIAFLIASGWAAQTYLINRHELKEIVRFDYVHGDIKWEPRNAIIFPGFFMCSGLCAGMFGIGGGMITVPLMLSMGVHPSVVTATSSTMVFFTAALSASSFAVFGLILWDYAIVCLLVGFFASLVGQGIMQRARQTGTEGANFERNSFIAYCIGGVILVSALLMTMQYVLSIVNYDENTSRSDQGGLCEGYRISS